MTLAVSLPVDYRSDVDSDCCQFDTEHDRSGRNADPISGGGVGDVRFGTVVSEKTDPILPDILGHVSGHSPGVL